MRRPGRSARVALGLIAFLGLAAGSQAQTCWVYTDTELAPAPIKCVSKADLVSNCSYGNINAPTDCTTVPAAAPQTIREMHKIWHDCFGAVGGPVPPAGRSQRWYAFHRQFELDFNRWRRDLGIDPIEQVDWCPGVLLEVATEDVGGGNPPDNANGCGGGFQRPANTPCTTCEAFPQCFFVTNGGPMNCAASSGCKNDDGTVNFPGFNSIDDFQNVDDVAKLLDAQFHGNMHGAVSFGDGLLAYNNDCNSSNCSPRDPMFWRLHHALDDIVRAWQDQKAVDVVVIVDRSGSMSDLDSSGVTKLDAALAALDNFADLLEDGRADNVKNRIGVVSYSDTATTNLIMTEVTPALRTPGGDFDDAKTDIANGGPGGCTGIGAALQRAVELLCPPGDCRGFSDPNDNDRKAILLLTDGVENVAPCLQPAGPAGGSCGTQCFGSAFDLEKLEFTQVVAVGFGSASNLNGELLTLVAERQGGIYLQNPSMPGDDLKDFFVKAFAQLSTEFLMLDPKGTLAADAAASTPVEYSGCTDSMLTFTSGWHQAITPGALKLLVTSPAGDLVRAGDPRVEASRQALWDFSRVGLPYRGASSGTWRAQLVRPHNAYVNGFAPDAFADPDEGTALVRREIQRLCPEGCRSVVLFEAGLRGPRSAYRDAVEAEKLSGLLGSVAQTGSEAELAKLLGGRVDLVVYAQMNAADVAHPYDSALSAHVCRGGRAILSDARPRMRAPLFKCAGVSATEPTNYRVITNGDLVTRALKLVNPGYPVYAHAVIGGSLQAFADNQVAAVAARVEKGVEERWFVDVLGSSLGKLSPHRRRTRWKTGEVPIASVRMLPSYIRAGGWDHVDARVEVEFPRVGEGTLLAEAGLREPRKVKGETIDARAAALAAITIPKATATFPLFDNGADPDVSPRNGVWSGDLTGLGKTDGVYKLRYIFDLTANGCTTRRELTESVYVDVGVDPQTTKLVTNSQSRPDGSVATTVQLTPVDRLGNPLGPGRGGPIFCQPATVCKVTGNLTDDGRGGYSFAVVTSPGVGSVRVDAFGVRFDVPIACPNCPRLERVTIDSPQVVNKQNAKGVVRLAGKAPSNAAGGAVVYLSSDLKRVASVPESVLVPAGATEATFPVTVYHVHTRPETVTVEASFGGSRSRAKITVSEPEKDPNAPKPRPTLERKKHQHPE
jgi:hypothetical protein